MKSSASRFSASTAIRSVLFTLISIAVILFIVVLYAFKSHWFPRVGLPSFDEEKAALLSISKRAAYEQELFDEIDYWNKATKKYPDIDGIYRREQRWRQMAADGFELAHIALRVLKIPGGYTYSVYWPMKRLETLAINGDVGAMCMMVVLVNKAAVSQDWEPYSATYRHWLEEGTRRGHPECLIQLGGRLLIGTGGYSKDIKKGLDYLFSGYKSGYVHGAAILGIHFKEQGLNDTNNIVRAYCWNSVADSMWTADSFYDRRFNLLEQIDSRAVAGEILSVQELKSTLRKTDFNVYDCIKLGQGF